MSDRDRALDWLRGLCDGYELAPVAIFQKKGAHEWPLIANDPQELEEKLREGGHFSPLPKESAALANIIEVSLVDYLMETCSGNADVELARGTERGYPDLELFSRQFGEKHYAIDIKSARRKVNEKGKVNERKTQSRITLYTGNTYFRYPDLHWPNTFRPFNDYEAHFDIIAIYTLDENSPSRIADLEFVVQESWKIGSHTRSSTTREYIGAIDDIPKLRSGEGEFTSEAEFYSFWRKFNFKIGRTVSNQLDKLIRERRQD